MSLDKSILIDSIIFCLVNIYIIFWVLLKKISRKDKLYYIIFFIILNSSYNMMVKPVHDYNLNIARTFIWRYKVIASLSIFDIIFLIFFIINLKDTVKYFKESKLSMLIYSREIIIVIFGVISFVINKGYAIDSGSRFLIECKSILYFFTFCSIFYKHFNYELKEINYIHIFTVILISGLISLLCFDKQFLWERYGSFVKIIDQEDASTISIYVILVLFFDFSICKKLKYGILFLVFFMQNILCVYKGSIVFLIFSLLFYYFFIENKGKLYGFKIFMLLNSIIVLILVSLNKIINLATSQSIFTRIYQVADFLNEMKLRGIFAILFGLGIGTPFHSNFDIGDQGEIKLIDKANQIYEGYRTSVQSPMLGVLKMIGFVGLLIYIIFTIIIVIKLIKAFKEYKIKYIVSSELIASLIFLVYGLFFGNSLSIGGVVPVNVFYAFIISRVLFHLRKV